MIDLHSFAAGFIVSLVMGCGAMFFVAEKLQKKLEFGRSVRNELVREIFALREKLPRRGPRGRFVKHKEAGL